jgi:hypothetical protein
MNMHIMYIMYVLGVLARPPAVCFEKPKAKVQKVEFTGLREYVIKSDAKHFLFFRTTD